MTQESHRAQRRQTTGAGRWLLRLAAIGFLILGGVSAWQYAVKYETTWRAECVVMKFSPDGKLLAAAGDRALLTIFDVATGSATTRFYGGNIAGTNNLEFSANGRRIVTSYHGFGGSSRDGIQRGVLSVWDVAAQQILFTNKVQNGFMQDACFLADGEVAALLQNELGRWDIERRIRLTSVQIPQWRGSQIRVTPDGRIYVYGAPVIKGQAASVYLVGDHAPLFDNRACLDTVEDVALSPDGSWLVVGGRKDGMGRLRVWQLPEGRELSGPSEPYSKPLQVACFANSRGFGTVDEDGFVSEWKLAGDQFERVRKRSCDGPVLLAAWAGDGQLLATKTLKSLSLWQADGTRLHKITALDTEIALRRIYKVLQWVGLAGGVIMAIVGWREQLGLRPPNEW